MDQAHNGPSRPQNCNLLGRQSGIHSLMPTFSAQLLSAHCILGICKTIQVVSKLWALAPRARTGEWICDKGSQIHVYHKRCLRIFILFLFVLSSDKYLRSVGKHAWWENVSVMSAYFPKAVGCSCDWLNMSSFKSFTVGDVLLSWSIFSVSGCQEFVIIMEMHKRISIKNVLFYQCGDFPKKRRMQGP